MKDDETTFKSPYDKLRERYRLLLYLVQSFEYAVRQKCRSANDVLIKSLEIEGYIDEALKGKIKSLKEHHDKFFKKFYRSDGR